MSRRRRKPSRDSRSIQNPAVPLSGKNIEAYLVNGGTRSRSGEYVSPARALSYSPVWGAVATISNDIARLPWIVYERTADGRGKERAVKHPTYSLLKRNVGNQTTNLWLIRMLGHGLLYGNAYSRIRRTRNGAIERLEWLHSDWVMPALENEVRFYKVQYPSPNDESRRAPIRLPAIDVFHLNGLLLDELGGLSVVHYARQTIGRQLAAEGFGDDFFANLGVPAGWFTHPGEMSAEAQLRFLQNVQQQSGRRFSLAILEEGMKWEKSGMTPRDAMLVDNLKWGVKDVARYFSIPPHKLGDDSRVSYNSLEQEDKSYFGGTLGNWISRLEFEANDKLFTLPEIENESHFSEFLQNAWSKADLASRFAVYQIAIQNRILNPNEVRAMENLNPYDGGDEFLVPMNVNNPGGNPQTTEEPDEEPEVEQDDRSVLAKVAMRDLLSHQINKAVNLLANAAVRAAKKPNRFLSWVDGLPTTYGVKVAIVLSEAARLAKANPEDVARSIVSLSHEKLLEASECQPEDLAARVQSALESVRNLSTELANGLVFGELTHAD